MIWTEGCFAVYPPNFRLLISASLFPGSIPDRAFAKAVSSPNSALVCDQNSSELKKIYNRKFPDKLGLLDRFLSAFLPVVEVIKSPEEPFPEESEIRDADDRPIFRVTLSSGADIFLTGDKDFLESEITDPRIMTPSEFLALMIESA